MIKSNLIALISGLVFGLGLSVAQMTNPQKVLNFLDISGHWDASLIFVMAAALAVSLIAWQIVKHRDKPFCSSKFSLPSTTQVDTKLILGAILFGLGWGLSGLCPGPAIASLAYATKELIYFFVAMLVGMWLTKRVLG